MLNRRRFRFHASEFDRWKRENSVKNLSVKCPSGAWRGKNERARGDKICDSSAVLRQSSGKDSNRQRTQDKQKKKHTLTHNYTPTVIAYTNKEETRGGEYESTRLLRHQTRICIGDQIFWFSIMAELKKKKQKEKRNSLSYLPACTPV